MKTEPSYCKKTVFSRFMDRSLPVLKTGIVTVFESMARAAHAQADSSWWPLA
jgi:hypothetical protein